MSESESWASSPAVRRSMLGNRSRNTAPEILLRSALHAKGLRFRVDLRLLPPLRTRADVVFTRVRLAIFVDGCFWHGCPTHGTVPKTNASYWVPKLERNRARDFETDVALRAAGWSVMRFWEHEPSATAAAVVEAEVQRLRSDATSK